MNKKVFSIFIFLLTLYNKRKANFKERKMKIYATLSYTFCFDSFENKFYFVKFEVTKISTLNYLTV